MNLIPRIYARVFETPLMVSPGYLSAMSEVLLSREGIRFELDTAAAGYAMRESALAGSYRAAHNPDTRVIHTGGIAVIGIDGALHQRAGAFEGPSSYSQGYDSIRSDIDAAMNDERVNGVMLDIDSPGGEVAGNFSLVDYIASQRDNKPIWSMVNEQATSAAYNIAAATSRIVAPDTASVGSIGVLTAHRSMQGALANAGIKVSFIHGGAQKVDGNPTVDLPDDVRERVQARVDTLYTKFTDAVAANRGIESEAVRKTEAGIMLARDALAIELIDDVMSIDDALGSFAQHLESKTSHTSIGEGSMSDTPARPAVAAAAQPEAPASVADIATATAQAQAEGEASATTRIMAILDSEHAVGREALARHFATSGMPADAAIAALQVAPKAEAKPVEDDEDKDQPDALAAAVKATGTDNSEVHSTLSEDGAGKFDAAALVSLYKSSTSNTAFPTAGGTPHV